MGITPVDMSVEVCVCNVMSVLMQRTPNYFPARVITLTKRSQTWTCYAIVFLLVLQTYILYVINESIQPCNEYNNKNNGCMHHGGDPPPLTKLCI